MKNYKKAQAVLLPTTEETELFSVNKYHKPQQGDGVDIINQNLHIINDNEIKEDDWCLVGVYPHQKVKQCAELTYSQDGRTVNGYLFTDKTKHSASDCKKIIATTDPKLTQDSRAYISGLVNIPEPSQQFIEEYIDSYNKGTQIVDVLVEYEQKYETVHKGQIGFPEDDISWWVDKLKINPDNTITIKESKSSWDREEVEAKLFELLKDIQSDETLLEHYAGEYKEFNKWTKKSL